MSGIGTRATQSRQPRQVRKEATVTGQCVCSGRPGAWRDDEHSAVSDQQSAKIIQ